MEHPTNRFLSFLTMVMNLLRHYRKVSMVMFFITMIIFLRVVPAFQEVKVQIVNSGVSSKESAKEWSSLQLLDTQRNSFITLETLNKTFPNFQVLSSHQSGLDSQWYRELTEDILLTYPKFNVPEPLFIDKKDKDLFYANKDNLRILESGNNQEYLQGNIRIIYSAVAHSRIICGSSSNLFDFVDRSENGGYKGKERNYTADLLVPVLTPDSHSFQHFIDGVMPKIMQVFPFLRLPGVKIAIQKPRDRVIKQMLAKMNIFDRVLWVKGDEHVTSRFQINSCITPPVHPLLWQSMRMILGVSQQLPVSIQHAKIILLNRARSHNGGRNIKNQKEIIKYLRSRYGSNFNSNKPRDSLAKTKGLFSEARIIIGVHGGALYNLNLAPPECHVVEIMPVSASGHVSKRLAHTIVWQMSSAIGQKYWRLGLQPVDNFDNVNLPVSRLEQVLDKIDKMQIMQL